MNSVQNALQFSTEIDFLLFDTHLIEKQFTWKRKNKRQFDQSTMIFFNRNKVYSNST